MNWFYNVSVLWCVIPGDFLMVMIDSFDIFSVIRTHMNTHKYMYGPYQIYIYIYILLYTYTHMNTHKYMYGPYLRILILAFWKCPVLMVWPTPLPVSKNWHCILRMLVDHHLYVVVLSWFAAILHSLVFFFFLLYYILSSSPEMKEWRDYIFHTYQLPCS